MNTLELRVQEVISVADKFGELINKTLKKIERVFGICKDTTFKRLEVLFSSPAMRPRPPTVAFASLLVQPRMMARFAVIRGFIL